MASYEPIIGRYVTVGEHRVFFEEAGKGYRFSACTPPAPTAGNGAMS
jgi:hypothetical protein